MFSFQCASVFPSCLITFVCSRLILNYQSSITSCLLISMPVRCPLSYSSNLPFYLSLLFCCFVFFTHFRLLPFTCHCFLLTSVLNLSSSVIPLSSHRLYLPLVTLLSSYLFLLAPLSFLACSSLNSSVFASCLCVWLHVYVLVFTCTVLLAFGYSALLLVLIAY